MDLFTVIHTLPIWWSDLRHLAKQASLVRVCFLVLVIDIDSTNFLLFSLMLDLINQVKRILVARHLAFSFLIWNSLWRANTVDLAMDLGCGDRNILYFLCDLRSYLMWRAVFRCFLVVLIHLLIWSTRNSKEIVALCFRVFWTRIIKRFYLDLLFSFEKLILLLIETYYAYISQPHRLILFRKEKASVGASWSRAVQRTWFFYSSKLCSALEGAFISIFRIFPHII